MCAGQRPAIRSPFMLRALTHQQTVSPPTISHASRLLANVYYHYSIPYYLETRTCILGASSQYISLCSTKAPCRHRYFVTSISICHITAPCEQTWSSSAKFVPPVFQQILDCVQCWGLYPAGDIVVVARGSSAKPVVERVPLPATAAETANIRLKPQQVRLSGFATA